MIRLYQIFTVFGFSISLLFIPCIVLAQSPEGEAYTIQTGDWLSKLAETRYGNPLAYPIIVGATNAKATEDNNFTIITNPDIIEVGQRIWLPSELPLTFTSTLSTTSVYVYVYLDDTDNVYAITNRGKVVQLTTSGMFYEPKLASNNQTVGWLIITEYPGYEDGGLSVPEELAIYQDGKVINILRPGGFIRDWTFFDDGKQVVINSGPLYSTGFSVLIDVDSGKKLDSYRDFADNPPEWIFQAWGIEQ